MRLRQRAAPAAGHGGSGNAPFPPAARRARWAGGGSGRTEQQRTRVTHTCLSIPAWFGYRCYQTTKSSVKGQMLWLCGTDVSQMAHPRQKRTSCNCKSVILENYKWCSKSRVALCQQWGLTRKTWTQYPHRGETKEILPYLD